MMKTALAVVAGVLMLVGSASAQYPDPQLKIGDIEQVRLNNGLGQTVGALISLRADLAQAVDNQQDERARAVSEMVERLRARQQAIIERLRELSEGDAAARALRQNGTPRVGVASGSQCAMPDGTTRAVDSVVTFRGSTYRCVTVFDANLVPSGVAWTLQEQ